MLSTPFTVDSLVANEFHIEINGATLTGIFKVMGLVTYECDSEGNRVRPPFVITKMVQRDPNAPLNAWLRETLAERSNTNRPRRDVVIVAIDDGVVTRRWTVKNAWIQQVSYSDFDTASFEMMEERFTIQYEDIEEEFPAGNTSAGGTWKTGNA